MAVNLDDAKRMIKAAIKKAGEMNLPCSVAVVDNKGFLVALYRMDDALIPTADIARDKAWTAAVFRMPSEQIVKFGDPLKPGAGFNRQNWNDRLTVIPGGLPIKSGGRVIGGIGVSGGTPDEDVLVCKAAMNAINDTCV